jgi:hypothetical protein
MALRWWLLAVAMHAAARNARGRRPLLLLR